MVNQNDRLHVDHVIFGLTRPSARTRQPFKLFVQQRPCSSTDSIREARGDSPAARQGDLDNGRAPAFPLPPASRLVRP